MICNLCQVGVLIICATGGTDLRNVCMLSAAYGGLIAPCLSICLEAQHVFSVVTIFQSLFGATPCESCAQMNIYLLRACT